MARGDAPPPLTWKHSVTLIDNTKFVYEDNSFVVTFDKTLVGTLPGGVTRTVPREAIVFIDTEQV